MNIDCLKLKKPCYLRFDKNQMTNLQISMNKEMLLTNHLGGFCSTTIVGCNIRKYNGLVVVPIASMDNEKHALLSSLDETVIQHGAEFNLGIHKFQGDNYSPKGHKYIVKFEWDRIPTVIYRVGGVILQKEMLFMSNEHRLLIRYTLLDAHSPTVLRLRPFMAFRSVREFTHRNGNCNTGYESVDNGIRMCMYEGYPDLYVQTSKKNEFHYTPDWYMGLDYPKERERGYSSNEDLFCPGYFELPVKKGESVIFSAGLSPMGHTVMKQAMQKEMDEREPMSDFYNCLVRSAHQFHLEKNGEHYLVAGFPWFRCRARDFFIAMPGLTLYLGEEDLFNRYMKTAAKALTDWMDGKQPEVEVYEVEQPDVLLWAIWCLQQYAKITSLENCQKKYGELIEKIMRFILDGKHLNLFVHDNGLVCSDGTRTPVTWMNSVYPDGSPVIPRSGYIVEFNALWYHAICFREEMLRISGNDAEADFYLDLSKKVGQSFRNVFINKYGYLYDYVNGMDVSWDVRPNMLFAIALHFTPLTREERKNVLDVCTRELLTSKGIRSLTPKSGKYNPIYEGPQQQRDRAYHQGTAWPWLTGFYLEAYMRIYKRSGLSFIENQLIGYEEELFYHSLGSISEMFDGNPPFHGRGAHSFAINVAGILRTIRLLDGFNVSLNE